MKQSKAKNIALKILITGLLFISSMSLFYSCKTVPSQPISEIIISRRLCEKGQLNAKQLAQHFIKHNPDENLKHMEKFAQYYIDEANAEGINSDAAFAQMCLETGYLRFGNLVKPEWHNYCGLGAMDAEHPGEKFATEQLGVRAHIQHLQAYATTEDVKLNNKLIDPRYNWVHKTKYTETIYGLSGTWAMDPNYAVKINNILSEMEDMVNGQ